MSNRAKSQADGDQPKASPLHALLGCGIGLGVVLVLVLLTMAFGPSGTFFGIIFLVVAVVFIARRYRFSLRTFLLVVTILSLWLGLKLSRDARLDRALSHIRSSGGRVKTMDRQPDFPWGLWKYRYQVDYYGLGKPLSEQDFSRLEVFAPSSLYRLDVSNTGITDEDLKFIEGHTQLRILSLANETYASGGVIPDRPQNRITDAGLARLGQLKNLQGLNLQGLDITDDGLKILAAMPHLKWVYLDGTRVAGPGLAHLRTHEDLRMLELNACNLMPSGYQKLIQIPGLSSLGLSNTGITDTDLRLLEQNTQLGILRLKDTGVSAEAVQQFQLSHPKCKIER